MADYPNILDTPPAALTGAAFTGAITAPTVGVTGTTGAPLAGRFVGVTAAGPPASGTYAVGDFVVTQNGQIFACTVAGTPGTWATPADTRYSLVVGESCMPRGLATSTTLTQTSGTMRVSVFVATKTETSTQGKILTGGTAAAATPTLCRFGVYEIATDGAGTLVAACANDTALHSSPTWGYSRNWVAPFTKTAGKTYGFASLVVSGSAMPQIVGSGVPSPTEAISDVPLCFSIGGQADLPLSFTAASRAASGQRIYGVVLP